MSEQAHSDLDRLEELLVDRATIGLTSAHAAKLQLLMNSLDIENEDTYDLTAAAIDSAVAFEESEKLPEHIRNAAIASAKDFLEVDSITNLRQADDNLRPSQNAKGLKDSMFFTRRDLFGVIAIAASLLLAAILWFDRTDDAASWSVAQRYEQFLSQPPVDLVRVNWKPSGQPIGENVKGEVTWSSERQTGFMSFKGLPKNDPTVEQYQLWIFDKERDEKYPVDGGVFDITNSEEELIVAINAKIKVHEATLFAITVEPPGGVVVSDRKRLPVVAPVSNSG